MKPRKRVVTKIAAALAAAIGAGCTATTTDDFTNPTPGPPAQNCTTDPTKPDRMDCTGCVTSSDVPGCGGGSVGYACQGSDRPDSVDTNLVCSDGTPGAVPTGTTTPATLFCCAPYAQYFSECTVDTTIAGCVGSSMGFSCAGPESPDEADSSLTCSAGVPNGSNTSYCCTSAVVPTTCAPNGDACAGPAIGYSCTGAGSPDTSGTALACAAGSADGGSTDYCCVPFAQSPGGCQSNDALSGCTGGTYGFTCVGASAPQQVNSSLGCGDGTPNGKGTMAFCCSLL